MIQIYWHEWAAKSMRNSAKKTIESELVYSIQASGRLVSDRNIKDDHMSRFASRTSVHRMRAQRRITKPTERHSGCSTFVFESQKKKHSCVNASAIQQTQHNITLNSALRRYREGETAMRQTFDRDRNRTQRSWYKHIKHISSSNNEQRKKNKRFSLRFAVELSRRSCGTYRRSVVSSIHIVQSCFVSYFCFARCHCDQTRFEYTQPNKVTKKILKNSIKKIIGSANVHSVRTSDSSEWRSLLRSNCGAIILHCFWKANDEGNLPQLKRKYKPENWFTQSIYVELLRI